MKMPNFGFLDWSMWPMLLAAHFVIRDLEQKAPEIEALHAGWDAA